MNKRWMLIALFLTLQGGCGTWLGNPKDPGKEKPSGNSEVALKVQGSVPNSTALAGSEITVFGKGGAAIGTLSLTQARLSLKEIKIKTASSDTEERQEFEGPFVVNLLTDTVAPDPGTIEVPNGSYRNIQLKLAKLEKDEVAGVVAEGDPLIERSIYLTGSYKPTGGTAVSVVMDFDLDEEFVLGSSSPAFAGMDILEGQSNVVIIAFLMDRWFNFIGREHDLAETQGPIVLTKDGEETAKKIREAIKENIKASAKFGKDDDGDGELEDAEASEVD